MQTAHSAKVNCHTTLHGNATVRRRAKEKMAAEIPVAEVLQQHSRDGMLVSKSR